NVAMLASGARRARDASARAGEEQDHGVGLHHGARVPGEAGLGRSVRAAERRAARPAVPEAGVLAVGRAAAQPGDPAEGRGAGPEQCRCRAVSDGDEWVISGEKFFSSNLRTAQFLIVMAVTSPDVSPYKGMSMFLVPTDTPGIHVLHHLGLGNEDWHEGSHAH